ncbi:MAG: helix-turn-helix domain-containing protein, partial [Alphaproteobacteria bacterium]|nr:helix-turn-helix domain-containing protein [Alphaproteobacteria bacterium]
MTDPKIKDELPGKEPQGGKDSRRRGNGRGLHLQQIVEPDDVEVYSGVGTNLRAERQRRQLSLADISSELRIQQAHLLALEEGRTDGLPGPTYAIGFLRTYSEFLGLDGDEVIRQFKREATLVPVERRIVIPEPLDEARRPGLRLALVSLLLAGAVYGGWIFLERQGLLPIEVVAEPPERFTPYQAATDTADTAPKA